MGTLIITYYKDCHNRTVINAILSKNLKIPRNSITKTSLQDGNKRFSLNKSQNSPRDLLFNQYIIMSYIYGDNNHRILQRLSS